MKQYVITGLDHTDTNALERRLAVRQQHLDGALALRQSGNYIMGGAILNDDGKMTGSVMVLQFETDAELAAWKQQEPYIIHDVWETVDIKPFKVAFASEYP